MHIYAVGRHYLYRSVWEYKSILRTDDWEIASIVGDYIHLGNPNMCRCLWCIIYRRFFRANAAIIRFVILFGANRNF